MTIFEPSLETHGVALLWKGGRHPLNKELLFADAAESLIAFAYLQPSLIAAPTIRRHFAEPKQGYEIDDESSLCRLPYDPTRLLGLDDVLNAQSEISTILYRICTYNPESAGEIDDIATRGELYDELSAWDEAMPSKWSFQSVHMQQYHYLRFVFCKVAYNLYLANHEFGRAYYHFAAIVLWRPMLSLEVQLPYDGSYISDILLSHGTKILEELEECKRSFPIDFVRGSNATMFFYYVAGFLLVFFQDKHPDQAREPFLSVCQFLHDTSRFWPACRAMLKGLLAVVQQLDANLSQIVEILSSLVRETDGHAESNAFQEGDIPISWTLPQHTDFVDLLSDDGTDAERAGVELGDLMSKWSSIAIL